LYYRLKLSHEVFYLAVAIDERGPVCYLYARFTEPIQGESRAAALKLPLAAFTSNFENVRIS
jgi:hypothetical protein